MINLGIDTNALLVYEGASTYGGYAVRPSPIVIAAAVVSSATEQLNGVDARNIHSVPLVFREDMFDPVSRIRRGRFYERSQTQPITWQVYPHPDIREEERHANRQGVVSKDLATFYSCAVSQKYFSIAEGQPLVILGYAEQFTIWTVVSSEMSLTGEEIVALRARASFGALPDTQWDKIPEQGRAQVKRTLEILAEDIYRAGPESVIDRARDAASAILSAYVVDKTLASATMDLGKLVSVLGRLPRDDRPNICTNGGDIIAILHPRAKPSEQATRPLRQVREQDAELAVQLVGTMLCDLGWANWR
jgi:hypothetical protein